MNLVNAVPLAPVLLLSFLVTTVLVRYKRFLPDVPNHRSLHDTPIPRSGGIGIAIALFCGAGWMLWLQSAAWEPVITMLGAWLLVFGVSVLDDLRHVRALVRLLVHLVAAGVILAWLDVPLPWFIIGVLLLGWLTNLFNFMDGMDGLASGNVLLIGLTYWFILEGVGASNVALLAGVVAAAHAGFLLWNLPQARIFLGDAGSAPGGFLLGAIGAYGVAEGAISMPAVLLPLLPFVIDASATLVMRAIRGETLWRAHRQHAYQRLVLAGIPVRRVLMLELAATAACACAAIVLEYQGSTIGTAWVVAGIGAAVLGCAYGAILLRFPVRAE